MTWPRPGYLVEYTSDGTWRMGKTFSALVLSVNADGTVNLKVFRIAQEDLVKEKVAPRAIRKRQP